MSFAASLISNGNTVATSHCLLKNYGRLVQFKPGDVIVYEGVPTSILTFIEEGFVKIYKTGADKNAVFLHIKEAHDFINLSSLFQNGYHETSAVAITPVTIRFIELELIMKILSSNNQILINFLKSSTKDNLSIINQLISRTTKHLPGRVADVLLYLYKMMGEKPLFDLPLSRADLAQLASTTKSSFIKTLREFKHDEIIELNGKRINIKKINSLQTLSKFG
jgi:CRP-like cAMP-binding protein